jgi:hypothetical protein
VQVRFTLGDGVLVIRVPASQVAHAAHDSWLSAVLNMLAPQLLQLRSAMAVPSVTM